jgi:hypothetical protein
MKNKYTIGVICIGILLVLVVCFYSALSDFFFSYENKPQGELLKTILYVLGGIGALIGLWLTYRRTKSQEDQIHEFIKQNSIAEGGNVNDRFKNAIEHLGSDNEVISLGGIHSLHRIAKEHSDYRQTVFDILCSYIREKTKNIEVKQEYTDEEIKSHVIKPTICIQTTIDLLFKKRADEEYIYTGLKAGLQGVKCIGANFDNAILIGADLRFSYLSLSQFSSCNLSCAILNDVYVFGAVFVNSLFCGADIRRVKLLSIYSIDVCMDGVYLWYSDITSTHYSSNISFRGATLFRTNIAKIEGNYCGSEIKNSTIFWPESEEVAFRGSLLYRVKYTDVEQSLMDDEIHAGWLSEEEAQEIEQKFNEYVEDKKLRDQMHKKLQVAQGRDTIVKRTRQIL